MAFLQNKWLSLELKITSPQNKLELSFFIGALLTPLVTPITAQLGVGPGGDIEATQLGGSFFSIFPKSGGVQGGPLLVINGVITPISRVITPVTHL